MQLGDVLVQHRTERLMRVHRLSARPGVLVGQHHTAPERAERRRERRVEPLPAAPRPRHLGLQA
eukprot:12886581-Prorocentrum_lima.AAC.1